jgi:hypothetical protein
MEPYAALGIAALWALYGAIHFLVSSKGAGKAVVLQSHPGKS